jgi:hypothetical protein
VFKLYCEIVLAAGSITRKKSSGRPTKQEKKSSGRPTKRTPEVVDAVEKIIKNEPQISLFHFFSK